MLRYRTTLTHRRLLWLPVKNNNNNNSTVERLFYFFFSWNEKTYEKKAEKKEQH